MSDSIERGSTSKSCNNRAVRRLHTGAATAARTISQWLANALLRNSARQNPHVTVWFIARIRRRNGREVAFASDQHTGCTAARVRGCAETVMCGAPALRCRSR